MIGLKILEFIFVCSKQKFTLQVLTNITGLAMVFAPALASLMISMTYPIITTKKS